jgi:hypothetical protein
MKWYSAVALYAEYLKSVAKYHTEPYGVSPASIYQADEYRSVPESRRESFATRSSTEVPLGAGHYLRLFPVWMDYRGHFGSILPQAQALLAAAHLRGDLESGDAGATPGGDGSIGRNPFSQSAIYGVGYRFPSLIRPVPGQYCGSAPGRGTNPRRPRCSYLASPKHLDLQGGLGAPGGPVDLAHA